MNKLDWRWVTLRVALGSLIIGVLAGLTIRLPGLPYNIRELFWRGGSVQDLWLFGLWVVWLGAGSAMIALHIRQSRWSFVWLPVWVVLAGTLSFVLLSNSVTPESINDIIGSRTVVRAARSVTVPQLPAIIVAMTKQAPVLVSWIEGVVRYGALQAPVVIFTALAITVSATRRPAQLGDLIARAALATIAAMLLWLCKLVIIDWAGTDNLTELISISGFFGYSGLVWLYAAALILCGNAAMLWATCVGRKPLWLSIAVTAGSFPLAWLLVNLGLEQEVEKYRQSFSSIQFLLGPDRSSTLSDEALFARWCVVHVGFVVVLASGVLLATGRRIIGTDEAGRPM